MSYLSSAIRSLRTLQRSPEPVRRKWRWGASAVAMAIVVTGWVFYLNFSLGPVKTAAPAATEPTFFETLGKGFGVLGSELKNAWGALERGGESLWGSFGANLSAPRSFSFIREEAPAIPTLFEAVPPVTLPVQ